MSLPGYDAWKLGGDVAHDSETVYCWTTDCPNADGYQVGTVREYGRWYYDGPEECPACHGEWHDQPREEEDDDERETA